jgi:hypothetical protein
MKQLIAGKHETKDGRVATWVVKGGTVITVNTQLSQST